MFINDKVKEIHSNIRLFADDTSLYIVVNFSDSTAHILNMDLARLYNWAAVQWRVKFKPIKIESLLFSKRINLQTIQHFLMMFQYKKVYLINILGCINLNLAIGKRILILSWIMLVLIKSSTNAKIYNQSEISKNYLLCLIFVFY